MSVSGISIGGSAGLDQLLGAIGTLGDPASLPGGAKPSTAQTGGIDTMLDTALKISLNPMGAETGALLGSLAKLPNGTPVANPIASLFPGSPNIPATTPSMNGLAAYLNAQSAAGSVQQHLANHFSFAQQLMGGFLPLFNPMRYLGGIKLS